MNDFVSRWNLLRTSLIAFGVTCAVMVLGHLAPNQAIAQTVNVPNSQCAIGSAAGCLDCKAHYTPQFGCTAAVPIYWSAGNCGNPGVYCSQWNNYVCGNELNCSNGQPTGQNCSAAFTLCQ